MLSGHIKNNQPIIPVTVAWKLNLQEIVALVDTGFTGELKVSKATAKALGLEVFAVRYIALGDGHLVQWETSLAFVSLEGIMKSVSVLIGDGQEIIGVSLLRNFGYSLIMDFEANSFVLQKIPRNSLDRAEQDFRVGNVREIASFKELDD